MSEPSHAPFVSVIMNCFNGAGYLREALESVRAQTFADWEIIFWDNRSTDESASIYLSFDDARFRYFLAPEHTVLAVAKNLAVEKAGGEWLACLDCDDLWEPDKLERQVAIIRADGPKLGLVYGRMRVLIEKKARATSLARSVQARVLIEGQSHLPEGDILASLFLVNFVPQPSALVRRSAYWSVGGVNPTFRQAWDYDLWVKISKNFLVRAVQDSCCRYRIHHNNLSQDQIEDQYIETIAILRQYLEEPGAKRGMCYAETTYARFLFSKGRWTEGCALLLRSANFPIFVVRALRFVWRRLCLFTKGWRSESLTH